MQNTSWVAYPVMYRNYLNSYCIRTRCTIDRKSGTVFVSTRKCPTSVPMSSHLYIPSLMLMTFSLRLIYSFTEQSTNCSVLQSLGFLNCILTSPNIGNQFCGSQDQLRNLCDRLIRGLTESIAIPTFLFLLLLSSILSHSVICCTKFDIEIGLSFITHHSVEAVVLYN